MSFKNRLVLLSSSFLIFAAVLLAPAAQLTQEKSSQRIQQDRTNDSNRKQWSNQAVSIEKVRQVQTALKSRGFDPGRIDGVMGPKTTTAIRSFQSSRGLNASGMIDESTMSALQIKPAAGPTANASNSPSPRQDPQFPDPLPQIHQSGGDIGVGPTAFDLEDVREAQMALKNRGYDPGETNGMVSSQTQAAVRQFQMANGLPITGRLDQRTQAALGITIKGTNPEQRAKPGGPSAEAIPEPQDGTHVDQPNKDTQE
jgi:peptidoglycan hydrolase-like protein with peptidoglycan-binding domain